MTSELSKIGVNCPKRWDDKIISFVFDNSTFYQNNQNDLTLPKIKKAIKNGITENSPAGSGGNPSEKSTNKGQESDNEANAASNRGNRGRGRDRGNEGTEQSENIEDQGDDNEDNEQVEQARSGQHETSGTRNENTGAKPKVRGTRPTIADRIDRMASASRTEKPTIAEEISEAKPTKTRGRKKAAKPSLISGYMLLIICDFAFPLLITSIHNFVAKKRPDMARIEVYDMMLDENEKAELRPIAEEAAAYLSMEVNPLVAFGLLSGMTYGMKYVSL